MLLSFAYENSMPSHVLSASAVPHTCIRVASVPLLTDVHDRALTVARCGMRMMWARSPMRRTMPRWLRHLSGSAAGTCGADAGTDASEHVGCRVQTLMLGGPPLQLQLGGSIAGEELAVKFARWTPQRAPPPAPQSRDSSKTWTSFGAKPPRRARARCAAGFIGFFFLHERE